MKTRVVSIWLCLSLLLVLTPFSLTSSATAKTIPLDKGPAPDVVAPLANSQLQEGQPGDPIVTGELGLSATVQVFPYDVDIYGIYLVQGDEVSLVTSVAVDHINVDRVTAKLSPDGYKVAYLVESGNSGNGYLAVVGIDGLNGNRLWESKDPAHYITSFAWSHDSEYLAYGLSSDPFGTGEDLAASFENPDAEIDPLEETIPMDNITSLTGEIWVTDLYGAEQEQLVDRGAMDVLGWTGDDSGLLFTTSYVAASEMQARDMLTTERAITITTPFAGHVALVQTDAITAPLVTKLFTNTAVLVEVPTEPLYIDFQLLETAAGEQMIAALNTPLFFETLPTSSTTLLLADLSEGANQIRTANLTFVSILTNTEAIVDVQISPDGTKLAYMTEQNGGLWIATAAGLEHTLVVPQGLNTQHSVIWGAANDALGAMSMESYMLNVVSIDGNAMGNLSALPSEALLAEPLAAEDVINLNVPYIHQMVDLTLNGSLFNGRCACGPTSTAMALAFYNKLSSNPSFAHYVANKFGSFQSGNNAVSCPLGYGLYGRIVYRGLSGNNYVEGAWAYRIYQTIESFGIGYAYDNSPTMEEVKAALNRGHLVILSTNLTSAGHIVLVRGYTTDNRLVVNDPYGNKSAGNYGQSRNGADIRYAWNYMNPKWFVEVNGTPPSGGSSTITHWRGEYYNNPNFEVRPALVRNDNAVDFDWGGGSPCPSCINPDNFSARWTRTLSLERGVYVFQTTTDDGVRLYVDGQLVINKWYDQGATLHESQYLFLNGGNHTIKMEYYERGGAAVARLNWRRTDSKWIGAYFNNINLSGSPTFTREDHSVYFNWGSGGPGGSIGSDNFSVRWTKSLLVPRTGYYRFYARADDGVRVWINGQLRLNAWRDQAPTTYASEWLYLNEGVNSIKVEYYERGGGAYIRVWMVPGFYTRFYNNRDLAGSPSHTTHYAGVDFNWGLGGPPNTSVNNFSARWIGNAALSGGRYKFCVRTDDGVRLYIDGTRVINKWQDQGATTYCTDRDLSRGFHEIKMEYYENGWFASAELWWSRYNDSDALAASARLLEEPTEFDIWALYGDGGYLGPLVESDITTLTVVPGDTVFIPLVLRQP